MHAKINSCTYKIFDLTSNCGAALSTMSLTCLTSEADSPPIINKMRRGASPGRGLPEPLKKLGDDKRVVGKVNNRYLKFDAKQL